MNHVLPSLASIYTYTHTETHNTLPQRDRDAFYKNEGVLLFKEHFARMGGGGGRENTRVAITLF